MLLLPKHWSIDDYTIDGESLQCTSGILYAKEINWVAFQLQCPDTLQALLSSDCLDMYSRKVLPLC